MITGHSGELRMWGMVPYLVLGLVSAEDYVVFHLGGADRFPTSTWLGLTILADTFVVGAEEWL